jgi:hypothetical protein
MKLSEIHTNFKTDKGTAHSYINWYEQTFEDRREESLNILELGVLFGGSLKMWEHYFSNSMIYGIEDFSQKDGQWHYQFEPLDVDSIMEDLNSYDRISFMNFDCEDSFKIKENLKDIKFDIIIDDANHKVEQQKLNFQNYYPYINEGGIYICEDVQTMSEAQEIENMILELYPNKEVHVIEFDLNKKSDDRIVVVV